MAEKNRNEEMTSMVNEFAKLLIGDAANVTVAVSKSDEGTQDVVTVNFEGDDLGYMIGSHGRHLKALQYVLSMMINKAFSTEEEYGRLYVNVDVSGYKASRFEKIESMARKAADDARILGSSIDLEPMSPAERRVVHMELSKFDDVKTESHGEGRDRFVRIVPDTEADLGLLEDDVSDLEEVAELKEE